MKGDKIVNSFQLKIFAMILMAFDHLASYIPGMPIWFNFIGRIVAPIFFFFLVEGFFNTRSKKKYALRLFAWSLVMFAGSKFVMMAFSRDYGIHNNIFLSLAMSVLIMAMMDWTRDNSRSKAAMAGGIVGVIVLVIASVFTEATIYGMSMTLVFYFLRGSKAKMAAVYIAVSLITTMGFSIPGFITNPDFGWYGLLMFDVQWMQVFAVPFILMYNGERGASSKPAKYMFYVFYPVHIWIIYAIGYYVERDNSATVETISWVLKEYFSRLI
ncbi:TraX protein [Peptoclostridium litorale DSM 5388]|uniref:TraX family protein n=1 Tax=Peptoclostridium litorale DSM 5388 TaxID=1121324 RepID=A0A069RHM6_PEPLI|nr:hypothetical protein CLIT_10c03520 [Peptoclostridium litorale DSM 5388]SIN99696.1 TraX protein [Peptoclostridium litorale DSM 5388]